MEELFENKTKYSQKEYDLFLNSYKEEFKTSETIYMLLYVIFFAICSIFALRENEIVLGIVLIVGLIFYLWYKIIRPQTNVNKDKKSQKVSGKFVNTYKFYNNYFKIQNPDGKAQIYYLKLYRVVENKTHFYIYISREYAFIVSKIGFTKGSAEEFSKFIRKKVFTRYKNRIK